jgi:hypothetical protein
MFTKSKVEQVKDEPSAFTRPFIIQAAASIKAFSSDVEDKIYTEIQTAKEEEVLKDMSMSEINIRRYLVSLKIGDQGDCASIDKEVQTTIDRDYIKRDALIEHVKINGELPNFTTKNYLKYHEYSPDQDIADRFEVFYRLQ